MGVLDQVTLMKNQGKSDQEMIVLLREQGIPPKLIQDAIAQAQIKEVVSRPLTEGMQESIMEREEQEESFSNAQIPQPDFSSPIAQQQYAQQEYPQEYAQNYYPPQEYAQQENYAYPTGASDTSTLIDIAEQVFMDKVKKIQKQLDSLSEFKVLAETKLASSEDRLRRIESTIDKLQISILDKVGSYGDNLDSIKREMSMMQESFSKAINPILDKTERKR
ncbi:MAG TPA: hypothetical protein VJH92_06550 [Candidatus Nanoarchaeia archaeon]|nr:hypothetical protein [Candidatus Nanoarchaeia archaeon]